MIPKPEFYAFYNGEETEEKEWIRKLSDSYKVKGINQSLELKVKTININPSIGHEIMDRCKVLKEYGIFVAMHPKKLPVAGSFGRNCAII